VSAPAAACDACRRPFGADYRPAYHAPTCADCLYRAYLAREQARVAALVETAKQLTKPQPV
jgi:hypothetical protein